MRMVDKTVQFCDSQRRNNLVYFKDIGASMSAKVNGQLLSIKQERQLLSRLLVVAKSYPEFVIKDAIGDFEFHVAPPSNFNPEGSMIMLSSNHKWYHVLIVSPMPLPDVTLPVRSSDGGISPSVLIIDAMCVVNMATKTPDTKNAKHFAEKVCQYNCSSQRIS